ncbi:MAG: excinuclease ABC subunit UvrB [archaeon]|nr:excinuclease ABC subunit UvrB [archaeon]
MKKFKLVSDYSPKGDQPAAIVDLIGALNRKEKFITLLGATGTGKTYTISNIIEQTQKPTLIMAPNKTLAAQLYQEFKEFFPDNAVEYFISYYDYYQPEAYLPAKGQFIEKDMDVNEQIQRYRLAALKSLLTRNDVIAIASVSCIFGSENPDIRRKNFIILKKEQKTSIRDLSKNLVKILYERNDVEIKPGVFKIKGDTVIIFPAEMEISYRLMFFGDEIEVIYEINPISGEKIREVDEIMLFPAQEYSVNRELMESIVGTIRKDMEEEVEAFKKEKKYAEAQRLERRTKFDTELMLEIGYCSGIENYSRYFDQRKKGEPPFCLIDYFPKDEFLLVIDESHIAVPQVHGMIGGDISRKKNLVDFGFRLKSAYDNRPLTFEEWEGRINQVIFTSATPGKYELSNSKTITEQIIRPTGLIDPVVEIRPTPNQIEDLLTEIRLVVKRGERVLITTLTKKLAENIAEYYNERGVKITYLHSDINALERTEILRDLRSGKIDVVIGINLLREGLDLPEVSFIGILDADKAGFLRDTRSLIQTIGRASRNVNGHVIMYADKITNSIQAAIKETNRRRKKQVKYNEIHGIKPQTIQKKLQESISLETAEDEESEKKFRMTIAQKIEKAVNKEILVENLELMMREAAEILDFEKAAYLRDKIKDIKFRKKKNL